MRSRRPTVGFWALVIVVLALPAARSLAAGPVSGVVDVGVKASADDAEELPSGWLDAASSDLELVYENVSQTVGIRFQGIAVPRGAIIDSAWVQFTVDEASSAAASLVIRAQDAANPATFAGTRGITSRAVTTASVAWAPAPWPAVGAAGMDQRTPDLRSLVQTIVDRADWVSGNAVAVTFIGTGTRTAESFNGTAAPRLHIEWHTGDPATTTTTTVPDTATTTSPPTTTTTTTTTIPANQPPRVVASVSATVAGGTATLTVEISDDGLPVPPAGSSVVWEQIEGPATVSIANPRAATTTAVLPTAGGYQFRVTVSDGDLATVAVAAGIASSPTTATRLAVIGDYGGDRLREQGLAGMIDAWGADVVVTAGDNVNWSGGYDQMVGQFFHQFMGAYPGVYGSGSAVNRFFPALGNRDYTYGGLADFLTFFDLPGTGVASTGNSGNERYYDARIGNVHLFVVNSNPEEGDGLTPTSVQGTWLRDAMAASDAEWKIVVFHHPPFSSLPGKATQWMRWPFREWGADLVISGHAHAYERLRSDGLDYVISGLGANNTPLDNPRIPESQVFWSEDAPGALFIVACSGTLQMEFRPVGYGVVDTYTIGPGSCTNG